MDKIVNTSKNTALYINEWYIAVGGKVLMATLQLKSKMKQIECESRVIQFVTVIFYNLMTKIQYLQFV